MIFMGYYIIANRILSNLILSERVGPPSDIIYRRFYYYKAIHTKQN